MYKLKYLYKGNLFNKRIEGIYPLVHLTENRVGLCVRQPPNLFGFRYDPDNDWKAIWTEKVFNERNDYNEQKFPWFISDRLRIGRDIVIIVHPDGIKFYEVHDSMLKMIADDGNFHEVYKYQKFLIGNFFAKDDRVGVISKNKLNQTEFYYITKESLKDDDPLFEIDRKVNLTADWQTSELSLTKLNNGAAPQTIVLRHENGLKFYQFDTNDELHMILETKVVNKLKNEQDWLFFGNITGNHFQDMLQLNSSGLFIFDYDEHQQDYKFLHRDTTFTESFGWKPEFVETFNIQDFNKDGIDELLFTSSKGLTALTPVYQSTSKTFSWKSIFNTNDLNSDTRYGRVIGKTDINDAVLLLQTSNGDLVWLELAKDQTIPTSVSPFANSLSLEAPTYDTNYLIPKVVPKITPKNKLSLWWGNQWDRSFIRDPVDINTGYVRLQIPLIDVQAITGWPIYLSLMYSTEHEASSQFHGSGWVTPMIGQDYITVDFKRSIFPEDAVYYLISQGNGEKLELVSDQNNIRTYRLMSYAKNDKNQNESLRIEYHSRKEMWIIENNSDKMVYGKEVVASGLTRGALQSSLFWPTWRGVGRDARGLLPQVTGWYLKERIDKKQSRHLFYVYDEDTSSLNGAVYTTAIRLKTVTDEKELNLTFEYGKKGNDEYTNHHPVDKEGKIAFPVPLLESHYMTGYALTTPLYYQNISFDYITKNKKRLLSQIIQHGKPFINFEYHQTKNVLTKFNILPFQLTYNFEYTDVIIPSPLEAFNNILKFNTKQNPKISYGSDFAVISYLSGNTVEVQIYSRDFLSQKNECSNLKCPTDDENLQDYALVAYQQAFLIIIETNGGKSIYLYGRDKKEKWNMESQQNLTKTSLIRFGEEVVTVTEPDANKINIFYRETDKWTHQTIQTEVKYIAVYKRNIIVSNGNALSLIYYDSAAWKMKHLRHIQLDHQWIKDRFEINDDLLKQIIDFLDSQAIQVYENIISLSKLRENDGQLYLEVNIIMLDPFRNVASSKLIQQKFENLYRLSHAQDNKEGTTLHFSIIKEGGKFRVRVKSLSGKIIHDIRKERGKPGFAPHDNAVKDILSNLNNNNDYKKSYQQLLGTMIRFSQMRVNLNHQGINVGDNTIIRNTGFAWNTETTQTERKITLNDDFSIVANNLIKDVRLLNKNVEIKRIILEEPDKITFRFPKYIAYQSSNSSFNVLSFKNEKASDVERTFHNEQLQIPFCNYEYVVSMRNITENEHEIFIRPSSSLRTPTQHTLVSKVSLINANKNARVMSYERVNLVNKVDKKIENSVKLMPGDDKTKFGWKEMIRTFDIRSQKTETKYRWFNGYGDEVKKEIVNSSMEKDEKVPSKKKFLILDQTDQLIISDCSPLKLEDEMCAYFGFENYESGMIYKPSTKMWKYDASHIVKDIHALTGRNVLRLKDSKTTFEGVFTPKYQNFTYIGSTYIQTKSPLIMNSPTDHLQALIGTFTIDHIIGLNAEVKYQTGDWYYVEVTIDFNVLQTVYENYVTYYKLINAPKDPKFVITLKLGTEDEPVDFDHVRFSPINHDFEANVFNSRTGKNIEIIQSNGLISRTIYDHFDQNKIASINQEGQVTELTSSSQSGVIQGNEGTNKKPSEVLIVPERGFLEIMDKAGFSRRWKLDNKSAWKAAARQLYHYGSDLNKITPRLDIFNDESSSIRLYYVLEEVNSSIHFKWNKSAFVHLTRESQKLTTLKMKSSERGMTVPASGEIIIFAEGEFIWIWLDGVLLIDQKFSNLPISWKSFTIEVTRKVLIEDLFVLNKPQVTVIYKNAFGNKEQVIHYVDPISALVSETLYDELGRESIVTKAVKVARIKELFEYRNGFVTNKERSLQNSVWKTGKMHGEVDEAHPNDHGYPYQRVEYAPDPLNRKILQSHPGKDFNTKGTKENYDPEGIVLLRLLFPKEKGFTYHAKYEPNGSTEVSVKDSHENIVAKYIQVPGYDHLLSTYEYDHQNLIKILPPLYHEKIETERKPSEYRSGDTHLTSLEKKLQHKFGIHFRYNQQGQLIQKSSPDIGVIDYLYDSYGDLRFMKTTSFTNASNTETIYFMYNNNHFVTKTGQLLEDLSIGELQKHVDDASLPCNFNDHQLFEYFDDHPDPLTRNNVKNFVTYFDDIPVIEKVKFNEQQRVTNQTIIVESVGQQYKNYQKSYINDGVHEITYPASFDEEPLKLVQNYNRLGLLISIGTHNDPKKYGEFTYNSDGSLGTERVKNQIRQFKYNSPGFLTEISDQFLSEKMTYLSNGYGQSGFGDGIVMSTTFEPKWVDDVDQRWFQLDEQQIPGNFSKACVRALRDEGYIDPRLKPSKVFNQANQVELPLECTGRTSKEIAEILERKTIPKIYGHRFTYGNHQELVKAKYFRNETESFTKALQPNSFHKELPQVVSQQDSKKIWKILVDAGIILSDQKRYDPTSAIGLRGVEYFIRYDEIFDELKHNDFLMYIEPIELLLYLTLSEGKIILNTEFINIFLKWENIHKASAIPTVKQATGKGQRLWKLLSDNQFIPTETSMKDLGYLTSEFKSLLKEYKTKIPGIVKVLSTHIIYTLGEHPFDLQSYDIDSNGNHRHFYSGFKEFELDYAQQGNQIKSLRIKNSDKTYLFQHDLRGNVIKAEHKNIERIEYHPLSQRMTKIRMIDGRVLTFMYNAQGGRVLKRVFDSDGQLSTEIYYVRDEKNRVLVDRQTKFIDNEVKTETVTKYIYGPRGLLGFERNGAFFNVFLDHVGSVRLVIKGSEVVAAYDYLPYGELMREFGTDPDGECRYKFTGQEWDEETGLYIFHARVYDPTIGRFYQIDPKSQSFSPYKYAGNSPVAFIDPDGQFFWLFFIIPLAIGGTYLGGAATNRSWNPVKWDWKSGKTWAGIVFGGLGGGLLPVAFGASVGAFTALGLGTISAVGLTTGVGLGGAYLFAAHTGQEWDPTKWDWTDPATFNALFQGFGITVFIPGGIKSLHGVAAEINSVMWARTFLFVSYGTVGGIIYWGAANANDNNFLFWEWDWKTPKTYSAILTHFSAGVAIPVVGKSITSGLQNTLKSPKLLLTSIRQNVLSRQAIKAILKNPNHPLYKTVGSLMISYLLGSAANAELNPLYWNYASFATYEQLLYGLTMGQHTASLVKLAKVPKIGKTSVAVVKSVFKGDSIIITMMRIVRKLLQVLIYQKMRKYGTSSSPYFYRQPQLQGYSPSILRQAHEFTNRNVKLNAIKMIGVRVTQRGFVSLQISLNEFLHFYTDIVRRRRTTFPSKRYTEFLSCGPKRRKRGNVFSNPCVLNKSAVEKFKENPSKFMNQEINAISTSKFQPFTTELRRYGLTKNKHGYLLEYYNPEIHGNAFFEAKFLATSRAGQYHNPEITMRIKNPATSDFNFILTGEMQGCSLYAKFWKNKDNIPCMDLYHYNRRNVETIYINKNSLTNKPYLPDKKYFVTASGETIEQLKGIETLYYCETHGNYIEVKPIDGAIPIDRQFFYKDENGNYVRLENINTKNMSDILNLNYHEIANQKALYDIYDYVLDWESYSNLPLNYDFLLNIGKVNPVHTTLVIHRPAEDASWYVVLQNVEYTSIVEQQFHLKSARVFPEKIEADKKPISPYHLPTDLPEEFNRPRNRRSLKDFTNCTKKTTSNFFHKTWNVLNLTTTKPIHLSISPKSNNICHQLHTKYLPPTMNENTNSSFTHVENYTQNHFHGLLQLFDLGIRKFTGLRGANNYLDNETSHASEDYFIKATEIVDHFEEMVEAALGIVGVDEADFDMHEISYRLYKNVSHALKSGKHKDLKKLVGDAVLAISDELCETIGVVTAEAFMDATLNTS